MCELNKQIERVSGWDEYFYNICLAAAGNSKCLSREIGAVLVRDKSVISTGYNGPPRGVPPCDQRWYSDMKLFETWEDGLKDKKLVRDSDPNGEYFRAAVKGQCPRLFMGFKSGEGLDWCVAAHAEENAILNAARMGICTKGTAMYMTCGIPCSKCYVKIINAGIEELVVTSFKTYDVSTDYLLNKSDIKIRLFDFFKETP